MHLTARTDNGREILPAAQDAHNVRLVPPEGGMHNQWAPSQPTTRGSLDYSAERVFLRRHSSTRISQGLSEHSESLCSRRRRCSAGTTAILHSCANKEDTGEVLGAGFRPGSTTRSRRTGRVPPRHRPDRVSSDVFTTAACARRGLMERITPGEETKRKGGGLQPTPVSRI